MIFSWMFLVVISVFIARYSRLLWRGIKIREKDTWFQVRQNSNSPSVPFTHIFSVYANYI